MHNKLLKNYFYNVGDNDKIIQTSQFPFGASRQKLQFTCHPKIRLWGVKTEKNVVDIILKTLARG